jgi:hypothetical protein
MILDKPFFDREWLRDQYPDRLFTCAQFDTFVKTVRQWQEEGFPESEARPMAADELFR